MIALLVLVSVGVAAAQADLEPESATSVEEDGSSPRQIPYIINADEVPGAYEILAKTELYGRIDDDPNFKTVVQEVRRAKDLRLTDEKLLAQIAELTQNAAVNYLEESGFVEKPESFLLIFAGEDSSRAAYAQKPLPVPRRRVRPGPKGGCAGSCAARVRRRPPKRTAVFASRPFG